MSQTTYQNGIPVGDLLEINKKTGELARTATFEDGRKVVDEDELLSGYGSIRSSRRSCTWPPRRSRRPPDDFWAVRTAKYGAEGSDMRHGSSKSWYANGKPEQEGSYEYGKKAGTFTFWHENGQVAATGEYKADVAEGTWVWWHENGQKSAVGKYTNGTLIGEWRWWDEAGKLTKQQTYTGTESASAEPTPAEDMDKVDVSNRPAKSLRR